MADVEDTDESDNIDDEDDSCDERSAFNVYVFADIGLAAAVVHDVDDPVRTPCQYCRKLFKRRGMKRLVNLFNLMNILN